MPTRATLTALSAVGSKVWAVGRDGVILASGDAGEHWKVQRRDPWLPPTETSAGDDARHGAPLLDVLFEIKQKTGTRAPFEVISAYRSPETNGMLRAKSTGVAEKSMHLRGQAIDVRLADVKLERLRQAALRLKRGGVGFYPESQFVHVDTGRVRYW